MAAIFIDEWVSSHVTTLVICLIWLFIATFIAARKGFFNLPSLKETSSLITAWNVAGAFFFYLLVSVGVAPGIYGLALAIFAKERMASLPNDIELIGWMYVTTIICGAIAIYIYLLAMGKKKRACIFSHSTEETPRESKKIYKPFFKGAGSWIICYPWAGAIGQLIAIGLYLAFNYSDTEQSVIRQLKLTQAYPLLFSTMIACIIFIVPVLEETIFRGFLQTWLKGYFGRWGAIFSSALIFSCFHFTPGQGLGNVEIISSLFVLALFLGFLYERFQSLWASIGLHSAFNAISILLIIFT